MPSNRFQLNEADVKQWGKNALIFLAPALIVLISSTINVIPPTWKYGAIVLYILNVLSDILRKYINGPVQ